MVHWIDYILMLIFTPSFFTMIFIIIFLFLFFKFGIPLIPIIIQYLSKPKISDEAIERRKIAEIDTPAMFKNKILKIHYDNMSFKETTLGIIKGYSGYHPKYLIDNKNTKINTELYKILYYRPKNYGLLKIFSPNENLMFTYKQIKYIDDKTVILTGNNIEPVVGGYRMLTTLETPVSQLSRSIAFDKLECELILLSDQIRKLVNTALAVNPLHRAELENKSQRIDIPRIQAELQK